MERPMLVKDAAVCRDVKKDYLKEMQVNDSQLYQQFIESATEGTNVSSVAQFREKALVSEEAKQLASGKIQEIDFQELTKVVQPCNFSWRALESDSKGKQKGSIVKLYPGKGSVHGVGGLYTGMLLISNIQSKFPTHAYSFDDAKKALLKEPLSELLSHKDSLQYKEIKDLVQLSLTFQLFSDDTDYQSGETLEQVKMLELIRQMMCQSAVRDCSPVLDMPKNAQITNAGFLQKKYDNYLQADVSKFTAVMNLANMARGDADDSLELTSYDRVTNQLRDLSDECKCINDYIALLRNKKMDIVVYMDSVSLKKVGRDVTVIPKLRIHQIILHDYVEKKQTTLGLKLASKPAQL